MRHEGNNTQKSHKLCSFTTKTNAICARNNKDNNAITLSRGIHDAYFFSARLYCVVVSLWNPYFQKMKVTNHICIFFWNLWKINLCENRNCKLGWSTWSGLFRICGNLRRFSSAASMLLTRIVKKMWKKGNLNKLKHVFLISSGLQDRYLQTICYTLLKISQNADYMPT